VGVVTFSRGHSLDTSSATHGDHKVPLPALLGRAERAFNTEFDRRIAVSEFTTLSLAHSRNILRHLGSGPIRASQITSLCEVSKQAVSQQIVHLERNGYLTVSPDPVDHRARILTLTDKGMRAQRLVKRLFVEIETEWVEAMGPDGVPLRPSLTRLLELVSAGRRGGDC
jgi:DNA-binding MarR family transcriptional regulator